MAFLVGHICSRRHFEARTCAFRGENLPGLVHKIFLPENSFRQSSSLSSLRVYSTWRNTQNSPLRWFGTYFIECTWESLYKPPLNGILSKYWGSCASNTESINWIKQNNSKHTSLEKWWVFFCFIHACRLYIPRMNNLAMKNTESNFIWAELRKGTHLAPCGEKCCPF